MAVEDDTNGGLSPHVRGNHQLSALFRESRRSIPARAGEPCQSIKVACALTVYPRTCGGTRWVKVDNIPSMGLSPHVRGNRLTVGAGEPSDGSIPARAGEPLSLATNIALLTGLSPHVRGNLATSSHP